MDPRLRDDQPMQPPAFEMPPEVVIEAIDDSEPKAPYAIDLGEDFPTEIIDEVEGGPRVAFTDGKIQIDRKARADEIESVTEWLVEGVLNGDESVLAVYLRNLIGDEEEVAELKQKLESAFQTRDTTQLGLNSLSVNTVSASIAERNLIREGLRPELTKQPLLFRDNKGNFLFGEDALDMIIATNGSGNNSDTFKLIVGSKTGIDSISIPQELSADKFQPIKNDITKDQLTDVITIPVAKAEDGTEPSIGVIEVHMGPIDLVQVLADQGVNEVRARRRQADRDAAAAATYNPPAPAPSPGRWTSSG